MDIIYLVKALIKCTQNHEPWLLTTPLWSVVRSFVGPHPLYLRHFMLFALKRKRRRFFKYQPEERERKKDMLTDWRHCNSIRGPLSFFTRWSALVPLFVSNTVGLAFILRRKNLRWSCFYTHCPRTWLYSSPSPYVWQCEIRKHAVYF